MSHSSIPKRLPKALPLVNETKSDFLTGNGYSKRAIILGISISNGIIFDLMSKNENKNSNILEMSPTVG
jgi:hypothetical protein